jgi:hypothetical protein
VKAVPRARYELSTLLGTGTTTPAAIRSGQNSIGLEIDKSYLNSARKRLQDSADFFTASKVSLAQFLTWTRPPAGRMI